MVIHPFLFAIYPILFLFASNIDIVSPEEIVLPILITLLVAVSLWISLSFILKNQYKTNGLEIIEPIYYGKWCGREHFTDNQDFIIAKKI